MSWIENTSSVGNGGLRSPNMENMWYIKHKMHKTISSNIANDVKLTFTNIL